MSEEEREAIEYWKKHIKLLHYNTQFASEHYATILLNYIDKLQKENELLKAPFEYANGNTLDKRYVELNFISKDKMREYCKRELAFKNRLEREKQEISEYNKGRFDTYLNIIEELFGGD